MRKFTLKKLFSRLKYDSEFINRIKNKNIFNVVFFKMENKILRLQAPEIYLIS